MKILAIVGAIALLMILAFFLRAVYWIFRLRAWSSPGQRALFEEKMREWP